MLINRNTVLSLFIWLLSLQGFVNSVLSGGMFSSWKQIIIVLLFLVIFVLNEEYRVTIGLIFAFILFSVFIFYGVINGLNFSSLMYNIFFYISWVPFFILGRLGLSDYFFERYKVHILFFIVFSAVGLYVDFTTDFFSFLVDKEYNNEFLELNGIAKRTAFIFNTSTTVMPIICGFAVIKMLYPIKNITLFIISLALIVSAYCSGSLSAAIGLVMCLACVFYKSDIQLINKITLVIILLFLLSLLVSSYSGGDLQVDRILSNDSSSESNTGRLYLWSYAVNTISNFNVIELLLGKGLGVTNSNFNDSVQFMHGESSYFQSLIEIGILGTMLRLAPFYLYFVCYRANFILDVYMLSVLVATAVAPIFGNITLQAILGLLIGWAAFMKCKNNY